MTTSTMIQETFTKKYIAFEEVISDYLLQFKNFINHTPTSSYNNILANVEQLADKANTQVLMALSADNQLLGGLVCFSGETNYAPANIANKVRNNSGVRLLAIDANAKGLGIGRSLVRYCIDLAKSSEKREVILHTSKTLGSVWRMYERIGFKRSSDLDFYRDDAVVFGFRLVI